MRPPIDLHLHTNASDGTFSPREVVALCAEMGFETIAISDHDTLGGIEEAVAAGRTLGIEVIPAIEMSAGGELEIHILGYFADPENIELCDWITELGEKRLLRAMRIAARLRELDVHIKIEDVQRIAGEGRPCCRPHIAQAIVEAGYARNMNEAFARYLRAGGPGYIPSAGLPASDIIVRLRMMGLVPVLAHGALIRQSAQNLTALIGSMARVGLAGLECFHSAYDLGMERYMLARAKEYGLIVTGGSDFHGANRPEVRPGDGLSDWQDAQLCLRRLREAKTDRGVRA